MMKKWMSVACSLLFILLLAACGNKVDEETAEIYIEKAESIVQFLNNEEYDTIIAELNPSMKAQLTAEQLAEINPVLVASGSYEGIEKKSVQEKDGIKVVVIVGKYSKENRIYTVSYDENDEIAGLIVQ